MLYFLESRTIYFIAGLMYFIMPLIVWLSMRRERNKSVLLWSVGGEIFGIGLFLFALRQQVPAWVSFELANILICAGGLLRIRAMQHLRGQPGTTVPLLVLGLLHAGGYVLTHTFLQQWPLFFIWALLFIAYEYGWISLLAHRLAFQEKLGSLHWITFAYVPMTVLLVAQAIHTALNLNISIHIITANNTNILIGLFGIFAAVVSNTSFLAMFVERAAKEREAHLALTAQRQATDILASKIAELDRQRSAYTMASTLSHELSQPLTSIQLYLDIWRANPQHTELQTILQGVDESTQLATGILQRMRDYGNSQRIQLQTVDLLKIHQQVMALLHNWLKAENVTTQLHTNTPAALIEGDALQLSQVLINLYRNAAQASAQQARPQLHIHISSSANQVTLQVRDNGPGFSAEALALGGSDHFYTTKEQGMGIGLSIVRNIVEQHNADITLGNAPEGGALVQITFPASK